MLTHDEVRQLKAAGFDDTHVEDVETAKVEAAKKGIDWTSLFLNVVKNGPEILNTAKTLYNLVAGATK